MSQTKESYITSREAAKQLGVSLRTVQLWTESGILPAWKTAGGHRRIPETAIEEMLARRERTVAHPQGERYKVLLVEDDPVYLKLCEAKVANLDWPVDLLQAEDGFDGLVQIGLHKPHLIITDLNMPGMDGFAMVQALNQNPELHDSRLVIATGLETHEIDRRGGLPTGVPLYQKPAPYDQLDVLLGEHLPLGLDTPSLNSQ